MDKYWNGRDGKVADDDRGTKIDKETVRKHLREIVKDVLWETFVKAAIAVGVFSLGYNVSLFLHQ